MGNSPVLGVPEREIGAGPKILTTGEGVVFTRGGVEEVYKRLTFVQQEPHLYIDLDVEYQALTTSKCYRYQPSIEIHYSCFQPKDLSASVFDKPPKEVPCPAAGP